MILQMQYYHNFGEATDIEIRAKPKPKFQAMTNGGVQFFSEESVLCYVQYFFGKCWLCSKNLVSLYLSVQYSERFVTALCYKV